MSVNQNHLGDNLLNGEKDKDHQQMMKFHLLKPGIYGNVTNSF